MGSKVCLCCVWLLSNPEIHPRQSAGLSCVLQGLTLKRHIDATLGQGKVREAVRLPAGEDLNEWLAVNTVDFYNAISVLYSTLDEYCVASSCPIMSAGPKVRGKASSHAEKSRTIHYQLIGACLGDSFSCNVAQAVNTKFALFVQYEYLWADGVKVKKPVRLTAPEYINALCDWIETQVRISHCPAFDLWEFYPGLLFIF